MIIQHSSKDNKGMFYIAGDERKIAEMTYVLEEKKTMIIMHTEVNESLEGHGIGRQLVEEAVNYARNHSLKIKARCTYAKEVLDEDAAYKDVYVA